MSTPTFFKLGATYQIDPNATAETLLEDSSLLAGIVRDSLSALASGLDSADSEMTNHVGFGQLLYGLSYLAEMSQGASDAAQKLMLGAKA